MKFVKKVISCYQDKNGVFYQLADKLDLDIILSYRLNNKESEVEASEHWCIETHWLVDWNHTEKIDGYFDGCMVEFEIDSTRFKDVVTHGKRKLRDVRNINLKNISVCSI